jgi:transcriptional regulator with XRE-family HTH domain
MTFLKHVRQLRMAKGLSLRDFSSTIGVGLTYLSRVEAGRLTYGDYPIRALIKQPSETLDANEE